MLEQNHTVTHLKRGLFFSNVTTTWALLLIKAAMNKHCALYYMNSKQATVNYVADV